MPTIKLNLFSKTKELDTKINEFLNNVLPQTLKYEGGYANVEGDNGGETYRGISKKANPNWSGWAILDTLKPLRTGDKLNHPLLNQAVADLYFEKYFKKLNLHILNSSKVASAIFDFYVHGGFSAKKLQNILNERFLTNLVCDGIIGVKTINAINNVDANQLIQYILEWRELYLKQIVTNNSNQSKFLRGWLNRLSQLKGLLLSPLPLSFVFFVVCLGIFFMQKGGSL